MLLVRFPTKNLSVCFKVKFSISIEFLPFERLIAAYKKTDFYLFSKSGKFYVFYSLHMLCQGKIDSFVSNASLVLGIKIQGSRIKPRFVRGFGKPFLHVFSLCFISS